MRRLPKNVSLSTWIALGVSLLALGLLLVARCRQLQLVNHDSGGVSQNIVYGVQTLLSTGRLYYDPSQPPFAVMQYSPLYYYVNAGLARLTRVHADHVLGIYTLCRVSALVCNLWMAGVLVALVRRFRVPVLPALIAGIWGFAFIQNTDYGRPDALYHLLAVATIYHLVRYAESGHTLGRQLYTSVVYAVLALFTKQSGMVFAPMLLTYLVLLDRQWRRMGLAAGLYVGACAACFGLFAALNGGFFALWENVHGGVDNGIDFDWFYRRIVELYARELAGWSALILPACLWLRSKQKQHPAGLALAYGVVWTLVFGFATALKWGSMPSYFTPYFVLGFCAFTVALWAPDYRPADDAWLPTFAFSCAVVFGLLLNVPVNLKAAWIKDERERFEHAREVVRYLREEKHLQATDGVMSLVYGELLLETTFINNLLYQNAIMPQKDVVTCCAFKRKRFDYSQFQRQANAGLVKYLIKGRDNRLDQYAGAQFTRFKKAKTIYEFDVYEYTP